MPGENEVFGAFGGMMNGMQNIPLLGNVVNWIGGNPTEMINRISGMEELDMIGGISIIFALITIGAYLPQLMAVMRPYLYKGKLR